jgi:hypothetical protein
MAAVLVSGRCEDFLHAPGFLPGALFLFFDRNARVNIAALLKRPTGDICDGQQKLKIKGAAAIGAGC